MNEQQSEIHFVRGIAWHDIAKPFCLGSEKHSRTGFLLLAAAGYREEAIAALCHVGARYLPGNLKLYGHLLQVERLPAVLLLGNALDRLAASTYSFMAVSESELRQLFQAWHNPFTRLPEIHPKLGITFQIKEYQRVDEIEKPLRKDLIERAPIAWCEQLERCLRVGGGSRPPVDWPQELGSTTDEEGQRADPIALLHQYSRAYPERTYPPVNDTVLSEHTRLSAVFAWVVYRNLVKAAHSILSWTITSADEGGRLPDGSDAVDFVSPKHGAGLDFSPGQALVKDHLAGCLVRITFSGHQQWVEEAARLDDLNGARVLTDRIRAAFKHALAEKLEVTNLAEFLWISESAFDLVYLLPNALGGAEDLEALIHESYEAAVDWLVSGEDDDSLKKLLRDDFQRADPPLDITSQAEMIALKNQLLSLGYTTCIEPVVPPAEAEDYGAFTAAYGQALLDAYRDTLEPGAVPLKAMHSALTILAASEEKAAEDVCTVCSTHPVYAPLAKRLPNDEFLKKVTHTFRDEPERPCLACIARRALAHKQVQVEALHHMLKYDKAAKLVRAEPDEGLKLDVPPALLHAGELKDRDDFLDMRAAFVRLARRPKPDRSLDIFPTVSYAADSMGNVAMLTLSATEAVFKDYDYRPARERVKQASQPELDSPAWEAFAEDYDAFCREIEKKREGVARDGEDHDEKKWADLLDQVEVVKPHLARALARQTRIVRFFERVAGKLEESGIRTLALNVGYPTGRWLAPAMSLPKALSILGETIAADLLAVPDGALDGQTRCLLALITPSLLDGTVVIFKQKFPIYLVMEAERALRAKLAVQQPITGGEWYGLHLALADLRGTLTDRPAVKAAAPGEEEAPVPLELVTVTLDALPDLLRLNRDVDRRTITWRAADLGRGEPGDEWAQDIADARLFVRSDWWQVEDEQRPENAEALMQTETFEPVLFLKIMARE